MEKNEPRLPPEPAGKAQRMIAAPRIPWLLAGVLLLVLGPAGTAFADYEIAPSCGYCGEPLEGPHQSGCPQGGYSSEGSDYSDNSGSDWEREAAREYEEYRQAELARQRQQEAAQRRQQEEADERQRQQDRERLRQQEAEQQRQREAERLRQQEADRRRQQEAEGRRTGIGPFIRTIHVPYPPLAQISWQRTLEISAERPPLIVLSPDAATVLGTIGKSIKETPQKVGEFILTCVGAGAGVNRTEEYLSILKLTGGYADNATAQIGQALGLIRRGLPAAEVNRFLREQDNQALGVLAGETDLPLPLSAADEAERAEQGQNIADKINRWLTGTPTGKLKTPGD